MLPGAGASGSDWIGWSPDGVVVACAISAGCASAAIRRTGCRPGGFGFEEASGPGDFAPGISRTAAPPSDELGASDAAALRDGECGRRGGSGRASAVCAGAADCSAAGWVAATAGGCGAAACSAAFSACGAGVSGPGATVALPSLSPDRIESFAPSTCMPPGLAGLLFTGRLSASITGTPPWWCPVNAQTATRPSSAVPITPANSASRLVAGSISCPRRAEGR